MTQDLGVKVINGLVVDVQRGDHFGSGGSGDNGNTLLQAIQEEVARRLHRQNRDPNSIVITGGDYETDSFITKKLCHRRYQTNVAYRCSSGDCTNTWSSDYTTVEMLIQREPTNPQRQCNIILRLYKQLCKSCGLCGEPSLRDQHINPLIWRAADDIMKFFNVSVQNPTQHFHRQQRFVDRRPPHQYQLCVACLQGSCTRRWPTIDEEVQRIADIFWKQLTHEEAVNVNHDYTVRSIALYKQFAIGPCTEIQPHVDEGRVTRDVWWAWRNLRDMDQQEAAKEFLPLTRKMIDWSRVTITDT